MATDDTLANPTANSTADPTTISTDNRPASSTSLVQVTDIEGNYSLVSAEELDAIINPGKKLQTEDEAVRYAEQRIWESLPQAIDVLLDLMLKSQREQTKQAIASQIIDRVLGPTGKSDKQSDTPLDRVLSKLLTQPKSTEKE